MDEAIVHISGIPGTPANPGMSEEDVAHKILGPMLNELATTKQQV
jgi:hypothetical protein